MFSLSERLFPPPAAVGLQFSSSLPPSISPSAAPSSSLLSYIQSIFLISLLLSLCPSFNPLPRLSVLFSMLCWVVWNTDVLSLRLTDGSLMDAVCLYFHMQLKSLDCCELACRFPENPFRSDSWVLSHLGWHHKCSIRAFCGHQPSLAALVTIWSHY